MNGFDPYTPYSAGFFSASGSARAVDYEAPTANEAIRLLHEAVREVTGKAVDAKPAKARIGFLP